MFSTISLERILFTRSKICYCLLCVIDFTITLEAFTRLLRDRDGLDRASLTGLTLKDVLHAAERYRFMSIVVLKIYFSIWLTLISQIAFSTTCHGVY